VNSLSGVRESGLRDEHAAMQVAKWNVMVARERRREHILRAKETENRHYDLVVP
jgi:hypothetical protein